jgi:hypothetical protein
MTHKKLIPIAEKISLDVFDGMEPDDWHAPFAVSWAGQTWTVSLAQLSENPLAKLKAHLGESIFEQVVEKQGYVPSPDLFQSYRGTRDLSLYYCFLDDHLPDKQILAIVSCGEFQPARWQAYIEGIWQFT